MIALLKRILFSLLFYSFLLSCSNKNKSDFENEQLQQLEYKVLNVKKIGKSYIYDLTNNKDCNKTTIKYLGIIKTNKGKKYKILNSFFVYTANSTCHGTSNIKIYDMKNKYLGGYYVGMPNDLPVKIINNKYICWENTNECDFRKDYKVNFENGLPKNFFLPCTEKGGDVYVFSKE